VPYFQVVVLALGQGKPLSLLSPTSQIVAVRGVPVRCVD
jgi:hypothetical protein